MENLNASAVRGSGQIVVAGAGYGRLHAALRLTAKLRNHPKVRLVRDALRRDPEDRWAAAFGQIAGYSFVVAVVTGVLLLPFFRPSMATVMYHGSYRLLDGVR